MALLPIALASSLFAVTFSISHSLPVLGDGAHHVQIIEEMEASGDVLTPTVAHYPPLYHILGAQLYSFLGPIGIQLISPLAIALASLFMYLIVTELTGKALLGLITQALMSFSPLLIYYSSLILMEPLVVAMILFGVYTLLLASRNKTWRLLVLVALAVAGAAVMKQTGLILPIVAVLFFVISRAGWRRTATLVVLVSAIAAWPYIFMFSRNDGLIGTAARPPTVLQEKSQSITGKVLYGDAWRHVPGWSWELEDELDSGRFYDLGTRAHKLSQIPLRSLIHWDQFAALHSLYPDSFLSTLPASRPWLFKGLNILLIAGFLIVLAKAVRSPPWQLVVLLLIASYPALNFGNDTKRYLLHISVIAAVLPVVALWIGHRLITTWASRAGAGSKIRTIALVGLANGVVAALAILAVLEIYPLSTHQVQVTEERRFTQGGGFVSPGGIDSIRVAADWLNQNSKPDDRYMAASPHEWQYYSKRRGLWAQGLDYRLYFLPAERIDYFMRQAGARFVIIRRNQLMADQYWNHIERVPLSFQSKIQRLYPEVYVSPYGDIIIYEIPPQEPL